jgi:acetylornithine deacetylase/succinyl-diaminopimelate desuccinylase-like protein
MEKTQQFIGQNKEKFVAELFDLLRIPSVSADPAFQQNVTACAEFLATHFKQIGLDEVCIYPTAGHPIVYAEKIIDLKSYVYNENLIDSISTIEDINTILKQLREVFAPPL